MASVRNLTLTYGYLM